MTRCCKELSQKSPPKVLSTYQEKKQDEAEEPSTNEAEGLTFNGGKEFIFEDDTFLDFDVEDAELKNNPVFVYLGSTFDKEGVRGLQLNSLDVSSDTYKRYKMTSSKS